MANKSYSLAHTKWMCKYHIVFTPKYRRKIIYNKYREDLVEIMKTLCKYKGVEIIEGHMMPDHVHMLVAIPPRISVSSFMGYLKGKSALSLCQVIVGRIPAIFKKSSFQLLSRSTSARMKQGSRKFSIV